MKHWKLGLVGLTVIVSCLVGCARQVFITEADSEHYKALDSRIGAGPDLDTNPSYALQPGVWNQPIPPTVDSPDRPIRYITLQEAFAIALERGSVGTEGVTVATIISGSLGIPSEALPEFAGFSTDVSSTDSIRVFSLDPALVGANIESALSKFDAHWFTSLTWNKTDNAITNILASFQNGDGFNLNSGIIKPLPTGGVANITWITDYTKLSAVPLGAVTANPAWRPQLQFSFEQPLLRNYGIEINQLNSSHPGSILNPISPATTERQVGTEGILITRVRVDQQRAQFQKLVNFMLLNVEAAYWNLYAAYGALWANDRALAEALELWTNFKDRVDRGLALPQDERRVLAQLEQFRAQRYGVGGATAGSLLNVLERERQLRLLLGLIDDGTRLVPVDAPALAPYQPDWGTAVLEALNNRPELILTRQQLKARQFDVMIQKNQLRPDLRFISSYNINGLGETLNGPLTVGGTPNNALASLATDRFNTWQFGFRMDVPIGFRDAHAQLRIARLNLSRAYLNLREAEQKSLSTLQGTYSAIFASQHAIQAWQAAVKAAVEEYNLTRAREDIVPDKSVWLEQLLTAQQVAAQSASSYYSAIAAYNTALAGWQFAKGTIMQYDNASISEGPLPAFAAQRAVDHERERSAALKLRERPSGPMNAVPGAYPINWDPTGSMMPMATDAPPSVPQMMQGAPPVNGASGKNTTPPAMPMAPTGNVSPYGTVTAPAIPPGSTVTPAASSYQPWPSR